MAQKRKPAKAASKLPALPASRSYRQLLDEVIGLVETGRASAGRVVNQAITATYWLVGRRIFEHEQSGAPGPNMGMS